MKYLLLLLLLFILSCSKGIPESSPMAKEYTKLFYHKESFDYNLKGPVKEVTQTRYRASGDTTSFRVSRKDNSKKLPLYFDYIRFNRAGYVELIKKYDHTVDYNYGQFGNNLTTTQDTTVKIFTYNNANVLIQKSVQKASITRSRRDKKVVSQKTETTNDAIVYKKDMIKAVGQESGKVTENIRVARNDSFVQYRWFTGNEDSAGTVAFSQAVDGVFYKTQDQNNGYAVVFEYQFKDRTLHIIKATQKEDKKPTLHMEYVCNEHQDMVSSKVTRGPNAQSAFSEKIFRYTYDEHNNWIECVAFVRRNAFRIIRREITYWE